MLPIDEVPGARAIQRIGSENTVFDLFIGVGPLLVVLVAVVGRTAATEALAAAYLVAFCLYVGYRWVSLENAD